MGGWLNESGFSKEKLCSRAEAEVRNFKCRLFFCGSGTAEIQVTVYCAKLRNFKSQIVLCAKAELLNFET